MTEPTHEYRGADDGRLENLVRLVGLLASQGDLDQLRETLGLSLQIAWDRGVTAGLLHIPEDAGDLRNPYSDSRPGSPAGEVAGDQLDESGAIS